MNSPLQIVHETKVTVPRSTQSDSEPLTMMIGGDGLGLYVKFSIEEFRALLERPLSEISAVLDFLDGQVASGAIKPGRALIMPPFADPVEPRRPIEKAAIPDELRWQVWERDNFKCRNCGSRRFLTLDHIVPESRGGTLELSNLQTLCKSCNSRKGNRV